MEIQSLRKQLTENHNERLSHIGKKLEWAMNPEHPEEKKIVNETWQEWVELLAWDMRLRVPYMHEEFAHTHPELHTYIENKNHRHLVTSQDVDGKHHYRVFQLHMNTTKYHNDHRDIDELTTCPHIAWDVRQYANIVSKRFDQYVCPDSVNFSDSLFMNVSTLLKEKLFYIHSFISKETSPLGEVSSLYTLTVDEHWGVHIVFHAPEIGKGAFFSEKIAMMK